MKDVCEDISVASSISFSCVSLSEFSEFDSSSVIQSYIAERSVIGYVNFFYSFVFPFFVFATNI